MKKLLTEKFLYIVACLIIMGIGFVGSLTSRVGALERNDAMNSTEHRVSESGIDQLNKKVSKILCILKEFSEC